MVVVRITTSGIRHEVFEETLTESGISGLLLDLLAKTPVKEDVKDIRTDRPSDCFTAILSLYETGELHMPTGVCPAAFRSELKYWGVEPQKYMAQCCLFRYQSFFEEQETLRKFRKFTWANSPDTTVTVVSPTTKLSRLKRFRQRLWSVVDNTEASVIAKIYLTLLFIMVLMSTVAMALGTVSSFQRSLKKCELIEYMDSARPEHHDRITEQLGRQGCDVGRWSWEDDWDEPPDEMTVEEEEYAEYINENDDYDSYRTDQVPRPKTKTIKIPQLKIRYFIFDVLEMIAMAYFTIDFAFRVFSCPSILKYFLSLLNLIDCIALLGSYLHLIILSLKKDEKYLDNWVDILEFLQVLRVLRILRVVKNVKASQVLIYSIRHNSRDLWILILFLVIGVSTFASILFFCEDRSQVSSVPVAWWWALITMTTVGYGDVVPKSPLGRIVGCFCAISGVVLISLTLPVFVNNFIALYQFASVNESLNQETEQKSVTGFKKGIRKIMAALKPWQNEQRKSSVSPIKVVQQTIGGENAWDSTELKSK